MFIKLMIMAVVIVAVLTAIGGFYAYQKSLMNDLQDIIENKDQEIHVLQEQIAGLEIDVLQLETSNQSLVSEIDRKAAETRETIEELTILRLRDAESQTRLNEFETKLRDQERLDRVEAIRSSRKASLLLRLMDRSIKCYVENFDRVGEGKCISGKFVPNGERFDAQ